MNLDLKDEEIAALTQELHDIVENDRYPFSPRIQTLRAISASSDRSRCASPCRALEGVRAAIHGQITGEDK